MTYPKCPMPPAEALDFLRLLGPVIKDHCVAQEEHKDGSLHLHAFIRYESRVTWSPTRWDLSFGGQTYHGNYQVAKSWKNVLGYCQKGGNFVSSFDPDAARTKKAARNLQLLEESPQDLVNKGEVGLLQLPALIKAKAAYSLLSPPVQTDDVRGVWVYGPTGVGKSHFVRHRHTDIFLKSQNKWWDGYTGQSVVLLDDFDQQGVCLGHYLKIWADKWACTGEIKGATVNLHHTTFYITSQYTPEVLWPGSDNTELREAIQRRFRMVGLTRPNIVSCQEEEFLGHDGRIYRLGMASSWRSNN